MSSRRNGSNTNGSGNSSMKGKGIEDRTSGKNTVAVDQLSQSMGNVSMDAQEGSWEEVYSKKSKNKAVGSTAPKSWGSSNSAVKAPGYSEGSGRQGWNNTDGAEKNGNNRNQSYEYRRQTGRGNSKQQPPNRGWETQYMAPTAAAAAPPPLQGGWNWASRGGSSISQHKAAHGVGPRNLHQDDAFDGYDSDPDAKSKQAADASYDDEDDADFVDSDEDLSDDYDSDVSQKSHETQKKNKWFKGFFENLDKLTIEEISEQTRQWHCPACQNGPGAIDWYKLQPLITHAKTKGATRVKLHRELASLLEEELRRKGTSVVPAGEAYGKWKGLRETIADHEIVWPPMVVVMNTRLEKDDNDKWIGMGNQELLDYFSAYAASKARHSYGPQGHRGMSVLVFDSTAVGYLEAERLHKHFADQLTDRDAWERRGCVLFTSGGKRQLYGWLACKDDLDVFNQHCLGKSRLKFEVKSYHECVVNPMRQMNEDNQQLIWLKNTAVKQQQRTKVLEETFGVVTQKLRETMDENRIVRLRTKIQHEENREEMDYQEKFFKDQMEKIQKDTEEKVKMYEKLLQDERAKAKQADIESGTNEERRLRKEKIERFIASQVKGVEDFEAEHEQLSRALEKEKVLLRQKYLAELLELEKNFDASLTALMEKYEPSSFQSSNSGSIGS